MIIPKTVFYEIFLCQWFAHMYDTDLHQGFDQEIEPTEVFSYLEAINEEQPSDNWQTYVLPGTTRLTFEKIPAPI